MAENKKFWTSFEELGNTPIAQKMANKEFAEEIPNEYIEAHQMLAPSNVAFYVETQAK